MSKLGKKPILIPEGTKVKLERGKLILTGPKGSRELTLNDKIFTATISNDKNLILKLIKKNEDLNAIWGTTRSIINNALLGVTVGYEKILEVTGVGYRAMLTGNALNLKLGFSHDILYEIPQEVKLTVEKSTIIKINGIDKELVGKVASEIKMLKPIEPYKGKGIKEIKRVSKPGRRIYVRATSIPKIKNGLGLAIVSTSIGIMTDNDARSKNVGGEIICKVF